MKNTILFWKKVDKNGPMPKHRMLIDRCWIWKGNMRGDNIYGRFAGEQAHRVAYKLMVGEIPKGMQIDHICHNPICVNPGHLRICTSSENAQNSRRRKTNSSGYKGVTHDKATGKWAARIVVKGKKLFLGYHATPIEAHIAYCLASDIYYGDYANHGED